MFAVRGRVSRIPVSSEVKSVKLGALNMHLQNLMPPESSTVPAATKPAAALVEKLPKKNDLPIRFTIPEQGCDHKVTLQPEAQDPSPVTVRRHLSASPGDLEQNHELSSVSIIKEEGEGKNPGLPHEGKEGNIFMIRRHFSMNPYERFKEIQRVGDISSRDQAMGLHSQYHLALDKPPMKTGES